MIEIDVGQPRKAAADVITSITKIVERHPGQHRIEIRMKVDGAERTVRLGERWSALADERLLAQLGEFGDVAVDPQR